MYICVCREIYFVLSHVIWNYWVSSMWGSKKQCTQNIKIQKKANMIPTSRHKSYLYEDAIACDEVKGVGQKTRALGLIYVGII